MLLERADRLVRMLSSGLARPDYRCSANGDPARDSWAALVHARSVRPFQLLERCPDGPPGGVSPACGRHRRPASARRRTCSREPLPGHTDLRAARPSPTVPSGRWSRHPVPGPPPAVLTLEPVDVEDPARTRRRWCSLAKPPGLGQRLRQLLGLDPDPQVRGGRDGDLRVADVVRGLVTCQADEQRRSRPRRADQAVHRLVDGDEVGEARELVEVAQRLFLGRTPRSGCLRASSRTVGTDAEPTRCTCSSTLGRALMNSSMFPPNQKSGEDLTYPVAGTQMPYGSSVAASREPCMAESCPGGSCRTWGCCTSSTTWTG